MIDNPALPHAANQDTTPGGGPVPDNEETREWVDALDGVIAAEGTERAGQLLDVVLRRAHDQGVAVPGGLQTDHVNTIPTSQEPVFHGDYDIEEKIRHMVRWNAMAMVVRANKDDSGLGGHVATFASSALLYDVGFNHFWRAPSDTHGGDLIYFQGHASPGVYSRAFVEGRITEEQLTNFRRDIDGKGVSSYPHPWLMPDFWQFPTVSMGIGPYTAVYQARFMRYLHNRGIQDMGDRKVWAFLGDGEIDEPEALAGLSLAARERLDNLVFVVNCNLQRLDGPVRGNGKVIQELEGLFRGAGWNVIKVMWGRQWDALFERDKSGKLIQLMNETLDGDYQSFKAHGAAYSRKHFFGKYPETAALVADMTDAQIDGLNRGGHDLYKVYAAYKRAVEHTGQPTVILAHTVKGYGMGPAGEGLNIAHQQKKLVVEQLKQFRDRFSIPITDVELEKVPFVRPEPGSKEEKYLSERSSAKGGGIPQRRRKAEKVVPVPDKSVLDPLMLASGDRHFSSTMVLVRALNIMMRDKTFGPRVVPIVADESRTFGMEGMFRQYGIYSALGQLYHPQDAEQLAWYREAKDGQILQEGITEAGAISSWIAASTSYSTHNEQMIPFFVYYSMFGFQRIGDFIWAAADQRARGFLIGATAGRTTLNGEGLQHEDGHSHLMAATVPNCVAYDPTYSYEVAVIINEGMRRMVTEQEDVFYYLTVMNENYEHPAMPAGSEAGILRGLYLLRKTEAANKKALRVQLMGSGTILRQVEAAAELLAKDFGVSSDVWSATSFNELRRNGLDAERWNMLHPLDKPRRAYVAEVMDGHDGPIIAATDYMKAFADQVRPFVERRFVVLGTDGFGRSDTREKLRDHFEVDPRWITVASLKALADEGKIDRKIVVEAMAKYGISADKPNPVTQ
jgi:pyruvate dehydrogenase E1 component